MSTLKYDKTNFINTHFRHLLRNSRGSLFDPPCMSVLILPFLLFCTYVLTSICNRHTTNVMIMMLIMMIMTMMFYMPYFITDLLYAHGGVWLYYNIGLRCRLCLLARCACVSVLVLHISGGSTGGPGRSVPPQMKLCPLAAPFPFRLVTKYALLRPVPVGPTYLVCHPTGPPDIKGKSRLCCTFCRSLQIGISSVQILDDTFLYIKKPVLFSVLSAA